MSGLDASQTPPTEGIRRFPSRRDVHGSRIPVTADTTSAASPTDGLPSEPTKTPPAEAKTPKPEATKPESAKPSASVPEPTEPTA